MYLMHEVPNDEKSPAFLDKMSQQVLSFTASRTCFVSRFNLPNFSFLLQDFVTLLELNSIPGNFTSFKHLNTGIKSFLTSSKLSLPSYPMSLLCGPPLKRLSLLHILFAGWAATMSETPTLNYTWSYQCLIWTKDGFSIYFCSQSYFPKFKADLCFC